MSVGMEGSRWGTIVKGWESSLHVDRSSVDVVYTAGR